MLMYTVGYKKFREEGNMAEVKGKKEVAKPVAKAEKPAKATKAEKPVAKVATKENKPVAKVVTKAEKPVSKDAAKKPVPAKVEKPAVKAEATTKKEVAKPAPKKEAKKEAKPAKKKGDAPYVSSGEIKIELVKSTASCTKRQVRTVQALGLRRIGDARVHKDNPAIRGMCDVVAHLISVEKVSG